MKLADIEVLEEGTAKGEAVASHLCDMRVRAWHLAQQVPPGGILGVP